MATPSSAPESDTMVDELLESDTGARHPGKINATIIFCTLIAWALFQLWIASPLQFADFVIDIGLTPLNSTETRSIHLAFAIFLAFMAYPARRDPRTEQTLPEWIRAVRAGAVINPWSKPHRDVVILLIGGLYVLWLLFNLSDIHSFVGSDTITPDHILIPGFTLLLIFLSVTGFPKSAKSNRNYIPVVDWGLALAGACCGGYLYYFYEALSTRPGLPTAQDLIVAACGMLLMLEATRRSLGPPLMVVAAIFLFYTFAGAADFMPEMISHKGQSLEKVASHMWLTTEGVFGIALGVSTSFVFLFVLFGALLEKAGAGNYFIKVAFSLLGHLRGGPAKAAVLSSGMTGLISGSSIANVVTTGTFTVPLMKRVGFTSEKAGAVEVASSVNGQIMPPVMGAAAFLMVEYVGISYVEVVRHAFLPAIISYIALLYIVHLEAMKENMKTLPKPGPSRTIIQSLLSLLITVASLVILAGVIYYGLGWLKPLLGDASLYGIGAIVLGIFVLLIRYASKSPDLEMDDPNAPVVKLPETGPTVKTGLHFLLPIVVLVWCLIVERLSPGLSAYWATMLLIFILLTQKPLLAFFRKQSLQGSFKRGFLDLLGGLATGSRNMIGIGVATASAGIIVGTVSLTGVGQVMTEVVETLSGGNIIIVLLLTALISLILGMGLPTTANYIVVASLMAPVIVELSSAAGFIVPLIAIHLFVFYFGIMADVTPPVGLASFAAAAVSRGDPIRTGVQAFWYSTRTLLLPFIFIFNPKLLLIGVESFLDEVYIFLKATVAMLVFAAASQNFFITRSRVYESILLLMISLTLLYPKFWIDQFYPPYEEVSASRIEEVAGQVPPGGKLRLHVTGEDAIGDPIDKVVQLPLGNGTTGEQRIAATGLTLREESGQIIVDDIGFNSPAEAAELDFDYIIHNLEVPQPQPGSQWPVLPATLLLGLIAWMQWYRSKSPAAQMV